MVVTACASPKVHVAFGGTPSPRVKDQVVAINRGARDGISNGSVLAIDRAGERVRDTYSQGSTYMRGKGSFNNPFAKRVKLPDERVGTLLVFKTFNRVAYALILGATDTIALQEVVRNP